MINEILSSDQVVVDNSNQTAEQETEIQAEVVEGQENQEENNTEGEIVERRKLSGNRRKIAKLEKALAEKDALIAEFAKSKTPQDSQKPTIDDYQTYDDYVEALTEYKASEILSKRDSEAAAKRENEELATKQREVEQSWEDKIDSLDENYDDFDEVMGKYQTTLFRNDLIQAVRESDLGPQVQYHLAKNPDLLNKLNSKTISPFAIYKEIAKIESQLLSKPAVRVSKSSEPITPVKGSSRSSVNLATLDTDSYMAQRYPNLLKK